MAEDTKKQHKKQYDWLKQYQWQKGQSGNPNGSKTGKRMKTFAKEMFEKMDDEEKAKFLAELDPDFVWRMAEGNPETSTDITSKGEKITTNPIVDTIAKDYEKQLNDLEDKKE